MFRNVATVKGWQDSGRANSFPAPIEIHSRIPVEARVCLASGDRLPLGAGKSEERAELLQINEGAIRVPEHLTSLTARAVLEGSKQR